MKGKGMSRTTRQGYPQAASELPKIESFLESTFRRVDPRPDFVTGLKSRLSDPAVVQKSRISDFNLIMLLFVTLTTTVIVATALVRLVVELLSAFRIANMIGQNANKKVPPPITGQLEA